MEGRERRVLYFFNHRLSLKVVTVEENGHSIDDDIFSVYNYFRTQEQAEEAAELVKATLRKFHEDYGSNK